MRILTVLMALVFALLMPRLSLAEGAPAAEGADAQQLLDAGPLDQLVAPIALYPDAQASATFWLMLLNRFSRYLDEAVWRSRRQNRVVVLQTQG
jgi:hypothetical protein